MTDTPRPASDTAIRPAWLKGALEYGPLVIFLAGFLLFRHRSLHVGGHEWTGLVAATLLFIPAQVLATLAMWRLSGRLQAMQVITLVLVVGLGGITLWADDPAYIKMKPTFLYLLVAAVLGLGLALGKSWLGVVFGAALQMQPEGWRILTLRFVGLCLALALANELVWRNFSEGAWMWFKLAGLPLAIFAFMLGNHGLIQRHQIPETTPED